MTGELKGVRVSKIIYFFTMKDLLKVILKTLDREQLWFTDVKSFCLYEDWTINLSHCAEFPKRTIDAEFQNVEEAISYVRSF